MLNRKTQNYNSKLKSESASWRIKIASQKLKVFLLYFLI